VICHGYDDRSRVEKFDFRWSLRPLWSRPNILNIIAYAIIALNVHGACFSIFFFNIATFFFFFPSKVNVVGVQRAHELQRSLALSCGQTMALGVHLNEQ
jgi:hypothetical protein